MNKLILTLTSMTVFALIASTQAQGMCPPNCAPRQPFAGVRGSPKALNPQPEVPSVGGKKRSFKALNPQPEVPSVGGKKRSFKTLNPQPEVPSVGGKKRSFKALNPQPEVPSKPKKHAETRKKKLPGQK